MASTFLKSLSPTYQAMLVTEPYNGFSSVIKATSRLEHAIQDGLVQENDQPLKTTRKEPELFLIAYILPMNSTSQAYHSTQTIHTPVTQALTPSLKRKKLGPYSHHSKSARKEFTPLPHHINQMLSIPVNNGHLQLLPLKQPSNPLSQSSHPVFSQRHMIWRNIVPTIRVLGIPSRTTSC